MLETKEDIKLDTELFGNRLKYFRKERGLTQDKLSERANIDLSYIYQIEKGNNKPSLKTIVSLLNVLNTNFSTLMSDTDNNETLTQAIYSYVKLLDENEIKLFLLILEQLKLQNKEKMKNGI